MIKANIGQFCGQVDQAITPCEVNIDGKKDKVVIRICYDSPTNNEDKSNMLYNDICTAAKSDLIILGDFDRSGINCGIMKSDWRGKSLFE